MILLKIVITCTLYEIGVEIHRRPDAPDVPLLYTPLLVEEFCWAFQDHQKSVHNFNLAYIDNSYVVIRAYMGSDIISSHKQDKLCT